MNSNQTMKNKLIANIMIILVVCLPFYMASAFASDNVLLSVTDIQNDNAGTGLFGRLTPLSEDLLLSSRSEFTPLLGINSVTAKGSADGIDGIRRLTDKTSFTVRLDSGGGQVAKEQVWLGTLSQFGSCTGTESADYECTLEYPSASNTLESKDYAYTLYYYKNSSDINPSHADDTKTVTMLIDDREPFMSSFTATPRTLGAGNVTLTYVVNDRSCRTARCSGYCSGIKEIRFYKNNISDSNLINSKVFDAISCLESGSFSISSESLGDGITKIMAVAVDMFDQASNTRELTVTVDRSSPVLGSTMSVLDNDGTSLTHIKPLPTVADFSVLITEDDLDTSNVIGDFTGVNGLGNKTASCIRQGTNYLCIWQDIQLSLTSSADLTLVVYARDELGNNAKSDFTHHIDIDGTGPMITSITTDNDPYVRDGSTITVNLVEDGIGLNDGNVYLDLRSLGLGVVKADSCSSTSCTFTGINPIIEGDSYISVASNSADDLGNKVTGNLTRLITVDRSPPTVVNVSVTFIAGENPLIDGLPTTGASMEISATVREKSSLSAVADLSSFITDESAVDGSCAQSGNDWFCSWSTSAIDRSGPYTKNIRLTFTDNLGNNITVNHPVKVLGLSDEENPNYWNSNVVCSPSLVDREVTPYVDMKVYCVVKLDTNNAKLMAIDMAGCFGDEANGSASQYVSSASLVNDINSTDPIIEIILARAKMNINKITLICPFVIQSRVGDNLIMNPEIENATVNIYFYNNPEGDFGENIEDKIDKAKKKAEGLWNILGWLHKLFFWAEKICDILYTVTRAWLVIRTFASTTATASLAVQTTPAFPFIDPVRQTTCEIDKAAEINHKYLFKFGDKFCEFINCRMTGGKSQTPAKGDEKGKSAEKKKFSLSELSDGFSNSLDGISSALGTWPDWGYGQLGKLDVGDYIKDNSGLDPRQYMNAKDNLVVALVTGCIPGIIAGIEKIRQIECMYGVCLQEGVKGNGVPIQSCEDQKDYAYCKYVFGELFALIPFTAFFDYFTGLVKGALSDPLSALAIPFAYICKPKCIPGEPATWLAEMEWCGWVQTLSLVGEVVGQVMNIINADSWKINNDYCKQLKDAGDDEN
ncbi:MAG: hypothetical protein ABII01_07570 [Candidatus Woesearchaeota archaeon]